MKCNFGKMYFYSRINFINDFFFYCLLLYSIFSISFSQEEQILDFLYLLRIRSLNPSEETGTGCPVTSKYRRTPPKNMEVWVDNNNTTPYERGIFLNLSHGYLLVSHSV